MRHVALDTECGIAYGSHTMQSTAVSNEERAANFTVRLTQAQRDALGVIARHERRSVGEQIRIAVDDQIAGHPATAGQAAPR